MFNLAEFHAVQCQHCQDLLAEAERERLALAVEQAQQPGGGLSTLAHGLLARFSGIIHKD